MPYKAAIVTDVDGTLLNNDSSLSFYTLTVLNNYKDLGCCLILATARPWRSLQFLTQYIEPDYIISDFGAIITPSINSLKPIIIPNDLTNSILDEVLDSPNVCHISIETNNTLLINSKTVSLPKSWNPVYTTFSKRRNYETSKISIECNSKEYMLYLMNKYLSIQFIGNKNEDWYQLIPKGVSKGNALKDLTKYLGIDRSNIFAFGDDVSDIDMLQFAGIGIAVENAANELKAISNYTCESNNQDGVAKWLAENLDDF